MTIFHTLKYQLSDPPTYEELALLPKEVFEAFKTAPFILESTYKVQWRTSRSVYWTNIKVLRDYIYQLDETPE